MLCERESAKACWKISFKPLKIPLTDKIWVALVGFWRRHLWRQNSNSNFNVGTSNKLLPAIWNFLPTKSVWCKTGLFWPDWWKIHQRAIFYSNQLWLIIQWHDFFTWRGDHAVEQELNYEHISCSHAYSVWVIDQITSQSDSASVRVSLVWAHILS